MNLRSSLLSLNEETGGKELINSDCGLSCNCWSFPVDCLHVFNGMIGSNVEGNWYESFADALGGSLIGSGERSTGNAVIGEAGTDGWNEPRHIVGTRDEEWLNVITQWLP